MKRRRNQLYSGYCFKRATIYARQLDAGQFCVDVRRGGSSCRHTHTLVATIAHHIKHVLKWRDPGLLSHGLRLYRTPVWLALLASCPRALTPPFFYFFFFYHF